MRVLLTLLGAQPTRLCQAACVRPSAGILCCEVHYGATELCRVRSEEQGVLITVVAVLASALSLWWHSPHRVRQRTHLSAEAFSKCA
jgi:hypothetical protein